MAEKINIEGKEIAIKSVNDQDYISLTDIAKQRNPDRPHAVIGQWLGNQDTEEFLELWESLHNPDFKRTKFDTFKNYRQRRKSNPQPKEFISETGSIGIVSKSGRYGGTFAHVDIAFEFASWISAAFKLRIITEFQRLRSDEVQRQKLEWDAGRELARLNYPIQTSSIKLTTGSLKEKQRGGAYANEADMLNYIVFGMTAKQWKAKNPEAKGNMRDTASTAQNVILANLESFNSELIRKGASAESREKALGEMATYQFGILNQKYLPE